MGKFLAPLAFAGRMPLTNYLAQSVVGTTIFYGYGFGFWNQCGPARGLAVSAVIFAAQVQWSIWWFKRFQFGPAEWLWRALTYGPRSVDAPVRRAWRHADRIRRHNSIGRVPLLRTA